MMPLAFDTDAAAYDSSGWLGGDFHVQLLHQKGDEDSIGSRVSFRID